MPLQPKSTAPAQVPEFCEVSDTEGTEDGAPRAQLSSGCGSKWADRLSLKQAMQWDAQNRTIKMAWGRCDLSGSHICLDFLPYGNVCVNYSLKVLFWSLLFLSFLSLRKKELTVRGSVCTLSWGAWWELTRLCIEPVTGRFIFCFFTQMNPAVLFKGCLSNSCWVWTKQNLPAAVFSCGYLPIINLKKTSCCAKRLS